MSWEDRLKTASYTSPSGAVLTFKYEDVGRSTEKEGTAFTFPGYGLGAHVQDTGAGARTFPLRCFFWGEDYDTEVDIFFEALEERGAGVLSHPRFGVRQVVPLGRITQREDLKTRANQSVVEVVFWETIGDTDFVAPDAAALIEEALAEADPASAGQFDDALVVDTANETVEYSAHHRTLIDGISATLSGLASTAQGLQSEFDALANEISDNIDTLLQDPLVLAQKTIDLVKSPQSAATSYAAKIDAYGDLADTIVAQAVELTPGNKAANEYTGNVSVAGAAVNAITGAALAETFASKPEALSAAAAILDVFEEVRDWSDTARDTLGLIDTGETYQKLSEAVFVAVGRLVEISFDLAQERIIVLDRPRTILDVAAAVYDAVDPVLDKVINDNDLTGDEILLLPRGRAIKFYK